MITLNTDKKEVAFILADAIIYTRQQFIKYRRTGQPRINAGENGKDGLVSSPSIRPSTLLPRVDIQFRWY